MYQNRVKNDIKHLEISKYGVMNSKDSYVSTEMLPNSWIFILLEFVRNWTTITITNSDCFIATNFDGIS